MESICQIIRAVILGLLLFHSVDSRGQNIYNSKSVYYNMDTLRCVDNNARFREGDRLMTHSDNTDSLDYYWKHCIFKKDIYLPILKVIDENLLIKLDSCLIDASICDHLRFPDSSGYFIELYVYDKSYDTSSLSISITPFSNYYMAQRLLCDMNEVLFEWFGYNDKDLQGCFYLDDILCIVTSSGKLNYRKASCLFSLTQSTLQLALYSPIISIVKASHATRPEYYYYFKECLSE